MTNRVGPDDFVDAWHAIEAPAAALAATRATPADVEQLFHLCEPAVDDLSRPDVVVKNASFHSTVLHASRNMLLEAMGRPVAAVAHARFSQTNPDREFLTMIVDEHRQIAQAIADADPDAGPDAPPSTTSKVCERSTRRRHPRRSGAPVEAGGSRDCFALHSLRRNI